MRIMTISTADLAAPGTSLASLLVTCAICAALLFWLYVNVYRNDSLRFYFASLISVLVLAAAGIWVNLFLLLAMIRDNHLPTHMFLSTQIVAFFEWGAWPAAVVTGIALAVIFLFEPGSPDDDDKDEDTDDNPPTEVIGQP
jgi:uncharacterized membrane protein